MGCDTQEVNVGKDFSRRKRAKQQPKFRVHFSQVNQTYLDVRAADEEEAVAAAIKRWRRENWPHVDEVREI